MKSGVPKEPNGKFHPSRVAAGVVLLVVVIIAGLWVSVGHIVATEREAKIAQAKRANENLVQAFADHTHRSLDYIDENLNLVQKKFETEGVNFDLRGFADSLHLDSDLITKVYIFDASGKAILASVPLSPLSIADRDFFTAHINRDTDRMYIGQTVQGRNSGQWSIFMTRRANKPDGSFLGVVSIAVNPFYFTHIYQSLDLGAQGTVAIAGLDGFQRARLLNGQSSAGVDVRAGKLLQRVHEVPQDSLVLDAVVDGVTRIYAYKVLADYPIYVLVGTSLDEELARVRARAKEYRLVAGEGTALIALFGGLLIAFSRRERSYAGVRSALAQIMDSTVDGMILIDQNGKILKFNRSAQKTFQFSPEEALGKNISMLMPEPYRSAHDSYLSHYLAGGPAKIIGIGRQVEGLRKDGTTFPMDLAVGELPAEGGVRQFIGTVRDITERLKREKILRQALKMEAIDQLVGGICHDFNNLLAIVLGNLELLKEGRVHDEDKGPLVDAALKATHRGAELTRKLLAYSRQMPLSVEVVNVKALLDDAAILLCRTLGEKITKQIETIDPDFYIRVDKGQLENAILNLAVNARDAMPNGGTLTISVRRVAPNTDKMTVFGPMPAVPCIGISVGDTGTGIPEEILPHICDPFFTTKDAGKGSGLGLSMVYGFVKQSGGQMNISSAPGLGTTVELFFPEVGRRDDLREAAETDHASPVRGECRILIVEDDPDVRDVITEQLAGEGFIICTAADGVSAQEHLTSELPIDVLLTDMILPGPMNGLELAERARIARPDMKVIYMTGYTESLEKLDQIKGHAHDLLLKPFTRQQLLAALAKRETSTAGNRPIGAARIYEDGE